MLNLTKYFIQSRVFFLFVISVASVEAMQQKEKYKIVIHKKNKSSDFGNTGITIGTIQDTNKNSSHRENSRENSKDSNYKNEINYSSENDIEKEDSKKKTQITKKKNLSKNFDKKIESLANEGYLNKKEYEEIKIRSLIIRKVLHELRNYLITEIFSNDIQFAKVCCAINEEYLPIFYFAEKIYGSPFFYPEPKREKRRRECIISGIKSAFFIKNEYRVFLKEEEY